MYIIYKKFSPPQILSSLLLSVKEENFYDLFPFSLSSLSLRLLFLNAFS